MKQLGIGLRHKQTPDSLDWWSHLLHTSVLNTGAPQVCVLSPLLFTLYTYNCDNRHGENSVVKFANDTTTISQITNNKEISYREQINNLAEWCTENNLLLNIRKKETKTHTPVYISGAEVEQVSGSWESASQSTCHVHLTSLINLKSVTRKKLTFCHIC